MHYFTRLQENDENVEAIEIDGKDGKYIEKKSLIDKYQNRNISKNQNLKYLTYAQFCQRYISCDKLAKDYDFKNDDRYATESEILESNFVITDEPPSVQQSKTLPRYIEIIDTSTKDVSYMRRRKPYVLRFHKVDKCNSPHEYEYSQNLLFRPFKDEIELFPEDRLKCNDIFNELNSQGIKKHEFVRSQILTHLDQVESLMSSIEIDENNIQDELDPQNAQFEYDCLEESNTDYDLNLLTEYQSSASKKKLPFCKSIELFPQEVLRHETSKLDTEQRIVLDIAVTYARSLTKKEIPSPTPPLIAVQGGAGSGKSFLIQIINQHVESILRSRGDNPECPYIITAAFTGLAAANVSGNTLHSIFSFNFGHGYISLSDKNRDDKRDLFKQLKFLIIDEMSMISSDMLYKIHLRLQEITLNNNDVFGGISVFLFGDLNQLPPVMASYIFQCPKDEKFRYAWLASDIKLWEHFSSVSLIQNHRQGEEKEFADILNRIRSAKHTENDLAILKTRVFKVNDISIPDDALVITCENVDVNHVNKIKLESLDEQMHTVTAKVVNSKLNKQAKPMLDKYGNVSGTPLLYELEFKIGAKIILSYNVDVHDYLTNGMIGIIRGFKKINNDITELHIQFDNEKAGKHLRAEKHYLKSKYPNQLVTPIKMIQLSYNLSRNKHAEKLGLIEQFPIKLAYSLTAHKVQGMTIVNPTPLVIDLKKAKHAAQAYVMLSRVQSLKQLYILDDLYPQNIKQSDEAVIQTERLSFMAKKTFSGLSSDNIILTCINIVSLQKNFYLLKEEQSNMSNQIICLQETSLHPNIVNDFNLKNMTFVHNGFGKGRGIAAYLGRNYVSLIDVMHEDFQISCYSNSHRCIINIYRSAYAKNCDFILKLDETLIQIQEEEVILCGDLNICNVEENAHPVLQKIREFDFKMCVKKPTQVKGRVIDHIYVKNSNLKKVLHQNILFLDHDMLHLLNI